MKFLLVKFLHRLPPEPAHHLAIALMRLWQRLFMFLSVKRQPPSPSLLVRVRPDFPISFNSRVGLAAGFDKNAEAFPALSRMGFGFLEVGTVTPLPQEGNPQPRIWRGKGRTLINSLGFNNCGLEQFRRNIVRLKPYASVPVFANIGRGKNTSNEDAHKDYAQGFRTLSGTVDGFVVNVSSPNTPALFQLQTVGFIEQLAASVPAGVPVFVKFSPDLEDSQIVELTDVISQLDCFSGIVLANTSRKMAESLSDRGGLSGPPLFNRALHLISLARKALKPSKIIVGVGGISSKLDAQRMRAAGADLIEVYTGFVYHGPNLIREIADVD